MVCGVVGLWDCGIGIGVGVVEREDVGCSVVNNVSGTHDLVFLSFVCEYGGEGKRRRRGEDGIQRNTMFLLPMLLPLFPPTPSLLLLLLTNDPTYSRSNDSDPIVGSQSPQ